MQKDTFEGWILSAPPLAFCSTLAQVDSTRGFRCLARTREQQHAFNCPYQLSLLPKPADFPALLEQGKEL